MSADELISPFETFASEARTPGRTTLEYPIPLDAKLRSYIRFFFAGDFKLRVPRAESASPILRVPVRGAEALSPRNVDSSTACVVGGRRLERRRAFSMRSGPMFERRRETFRAAAERGVEGGRSSAGLLFILRRSAAAALEGKGGRCTPPTPTLLLLQVLLLLLEDGASSANEFRLRSESARLSVVVLSLFSSSSLRLPSVDAPRDLRKLGSSRLPRRVRVAPA